MNVLLYIKPKKPSIFISTSTSERCMMYKKAMASCGQECHLVTKPLLSHFIALH